jgi:two-component system, sensor histidine kinase
MRPESASAVDHRWIRAAQRVFPICGTIALLAIGALWSAALWFVLCVTFLIVIRSGRYQQNIVARFKNPDAAIFLDVAFLSICPVLLVLDPNALSGGVALLVTIVGLQFLGIAFRNAPRLGLFCAAPTLVPLGMAINDRTLSLDVLVLVGLTVLGCAVFFLSAWTFFRDDYRRSRREFEAQLGEVRAARASADQAALELGKTVEHLRAVLSAVPVGVGIYDEEDRLETWNKGYVEAARASKIRLSKGKSFRDLATAGMLNSGVAAGSEAHSLLSKRLAARKSGRAVLQKQENGRWYQMRDRKLPSGGVVSIAVDITDLKIREELASALFDRSPLPLWIVDPVDFSFLRVNNAAISLFGWSREEFRTMTFWDVLAPREREELVAELAAHRGFRTYASSRPWVHCTRAGDELLIHSHAAMITTIDGKPGCMGALSDVTFQIQAEKRLIVKSRLAARARKIAEASNAAKTNFLAMMGHELRTPLNGVIGTAQALAGTPLASDQIGQVQTILESGRSLNTVLNELLDLSMMESGRLEIVPGPVDVPEVLGSLTEIWRPLSENKGLGLSLLIDPNFPVLISADGNRLRQIASCLISNALKFTTTGQITIVASGADCAPGTFVLSVTDTGIGMTPREQGKLFKAFNQLNTGNARTFGGAGLGLAICKRLASLMGGDVSVVSAPGKGSTFTVTLPLIPIAPAESEAAEAEIELPVACSILVVEDNLTNQAVVGALLGGFGWTLTFVDDGAKAVEATQAERFDLILMDIHMPVMDGLEATRAIRRLTSEVASIPIIAVTADAALADRSTLVHAGFDGYVAKPIELETLLKGIATVVGSTNPPPAALSGLDLPDAVTA